MAKNKTADNTNNQGYKDRITRPSATLRELNLEAAKLDAAIAANLKELGYGG